MEMAVVKMNKFTLLTFESFKNQLLKQLQIFEGVHFKDLQDSERDSENLDFLKKDSGADLVSKYESEMSKIKFVQEKIRPHVVKPAGLKAMATPPDTLTFEAFDAYIQSYDYAATYEKIKQLDEQLKAIKVEKNKLKADNDNLKNWLNLDISTKELDQFRQVTYFVGVISRTSPELFQSVIQSDFPASFVEIFNTVKDETHMMLIVPNEQAKDAVTALKNMAFTKTNVNLSHIPSEQMAANDKRISELSAQEDKLNSDIAEFAGEYKQLDIALDYMRTVLERAKVCENFLSLENVVVISGWVACEAFDDLEAIISECCGNEYFIEKQEVEKDSTEVPIKLKNSKLVTAFEGITNMYALPRYNELDPTPLLTPFYIAFFGIMIGDVGYGLVLLILSIIATKVLHLGKGTKDFMTFLFYLSFAVMAVGFLYGGIFGITVFKFSLPNADGVIVQKAIIDSQLDIVTMIIYSVIIGVFHVLFGVAVKGYTLIKEGKWLDALFDSVFWILCILSGIGMIVGVAVPGLPAAVSQVSKWVFYAMLIGLTLTQGRENASIGTKLAGGLFGVYGITGYVGDIVSYTRLVALALSGAYIAASFNLMAGLMPNIFLKIVFGTIIFVFGQTLNLGLSVLGAYVHTCRLQYVEFFGKFYEGGGKPFKAFKLMNESVQIK